MPVPQENSLFVEQASCLLLNAGKMPTPQENLVFVEQASCLLLNAGRMPTPQENLVFVEQASCLLLNAGKMPTPQENSLFVEQASCLLLNAKQKGQRINSLPFLCFKVTFKWFKPLTLRYLFYGTGQNRTAVQNGYLPSDRSQVYPL